MITIDLSGKTALVTGSTGQLGRVMARTLAKAGADMILHYHTNKEAAERLADEIRAYGVRCMTVSADVGDTQSVFAMRDQIARDFVLPGHYCRQRGHPIRMDECARSGAGGF